MVKAIVFDCFGVLATEAWLPFKAKYFGHDPQLMDEVSRISWQADRGAMTREAAIKKTARLAGLTPAEVASVIDRNVPNPELFAYAAALKRDYKIGLLSNVAANYLARIFDQEQLELFDAITLSFETGFIKPEAEAFAVAAQQLHVELPECVFVDDQQRNVAGAQSVGAQALIYRDVEQLKRDLPALLR